MNLGLRTPDSQSHIRKNFNNKSTQFVFRYFSPEKYTQSLNVNQNLSASRNSSKRNNSNLQSSQIAQQVMSSCRRKIELNPQKQSDKFYDCKISQIKINCQNFYQQFHKKLFRKINQQQPDQKKIKLRLIKQSKKLISKSHINHQQQIKKISISLSKQHNQLKKDNQSAYAQRKPDLVIRLYNNQQNNKQKNRLSQNQNSQFWPCYTPRPKTTSKRKGIRVYSSASTNKSSKIQVDMQTFTQGNFTTGNNITIPNSKQIQPFKSQKKGNIHEKQKGTQKIGSVLSMRENKRSYLKNEVVRKKIQLTKKRVYSKSKLEKKQNRISRVLFSRDVDKQYHKFS